MNFYNIAEDRTSLNELIYILEYSLAHTLAAKHRLSIKKVFTKYGKPIKVTVKSEEKQKIVKFDRPTSLTAVYLNNKYMEISRWNTSNDATSLPFDPLSAVLYSAKETNILNNPPLQLPMPVCNRPSCKMPMPVGNRPEGVSGKWREHRANVPDLWGHGRY